MRVHLVDGTYELFRYYFALPSHLTDDGAAPGPERPSGAAGRSGIEVGAARGVLGSLLGMLEGGATHVGVATDHVIESFRNDLWPGYKTGAGVPPDLMSQFGLLEDVLAAAGFTVFAMVAHEADDALASAAAVAAKDPAVEQVIICTPDKDLAQCVVGDRVVQLDRRKDVLIDATGVVAKFGVPPESIPDYLALVGDSADGFPGLPGWGAKSAAAVLARYGHLEEIPAQGTDWEGTGVRGAAKLAMVLREQMPLALLFRRLAVLERDAPSIDRVDELRWRGPTDSFAELARSIDADAAVDRAERLAASIL